MATPLHIVCPIPANTNVAQQASAIQAAFNVEPQLTLQFITEEADKKKVETALSKNKQTGKFSKEKQIVVSGYEKGQNPFANIAQSKAAIYWIIATEYLKQLPQLIKVWQQQEINNNSVYVAQTEKQNISFLSWIGFQLFNTVKTKGIENGFVAFSGNNASTYFNFKGISTQNYAYKIASYAALAGKQVDNIEVKATPPKPKLGLVNGISNATTNLWQWMVVEPRQNLKQKSEGSIWQSTHSVWRLVFFCLAVLGIVAFPILSFNYGITWDEYGDAEYAKRVLSYYMSFGDDKSVFTEAETNTIFGHLLYYGPMVNLFMAFVAKYLSPFGLYETRHIIVALIGIAGILYAGRIGKLLGNWQAAVLVVLLLLVSPHFFGHQFNNQKDTPFAAGYIISIYYLICFMRELPKPSRKTTFLVALSFGLTIGVRVGGLLLPAYLLMCMGIWWLVRTFSSTIKATAPLILPLLLHFAVVGISAYIIGIIFWPWALKDPINNPIKSLTQFTNYQNIFNYELFEGQLLFMAEKPWYYLPKYILIQTPLFIVAGSVLAVFLALPKFKNKNLWLYLLLLFVAIFPVSYAIIKNSSLYNGWRQFLFVYPPLVIVAALGWQKLAQLSKKVGYQMAIYAILLLNIAYIAFWMFSNHPNQYVYFNEIVGGTKGAYSYYETDYYSNSLKQASDWFNDNVGTTKSYTVSTNNETQTARYYLQKENPNAQVVWSKEDEVLTKAADYSFITTRTMSHNQMQSGFFPPKGTIHTIDVDGIPLVAIVKRENNYLPKADVFYDQRRYDSAAYYCKKAVEYDPKNIEAIRLLGQSHIGLGNIDVAEKYFRQSENLYFDDYLVKELIGEVFFRRRQYDSAIKYFKNSTELRINFSKGYLNWGVSQFNQKKYNEAIVNFEKTIKYTDEVIPKYFVHLTKCYHALKLYDKGIESANTALSIDPNYAEAYKMLAVIYDEMGNKQQAGAMYKIFVDITGSYQ